ncbi:MAG: divalent-cation tolerance protein CutA [Pseudomonadota bacterium]|nr:divalent-cation tolerance protein CutA [Pseudomonadota bacterium]|tara:strand:- start:136 stop:456 length:321 start_codon:yes stop_codon:yes gene_type:complete
MKNDFILTLTSTDRKIISKKISKKLLEEKACACVNIIPKVESHYFWNGKLQKSNEWLIMIKSQRKYYKRIESIIKKLHNYEVPEIISIKIDQGIIEYLQWIKNETQ